MLPFSCNHLFSCSQKSKSKVGRLLIHGGLHAAAVGWKYAISSHMLSHECTLHISCEQPCTLNVICNTYIQ